MKEKIKAIPLVGPLLVKLKHLIDPPEKFTNSEDYWINRYNKGGNSGAGSYNNLAKFKADVLNDFVKKKNIGSVIELGSGDGNQLRYFDFPSYIGFDVSEKALEMCKELFGEDSSKIFLLMDEVDNQKADLTLSLDVIYHLIEDEVYEKYMRDLFDLSDNYVIIYAFDSDEDIQDAPHVRPRKFSDWVKDNRSDFTLIEHIPNKYPFDPEKKNNTSFADFYIYKKN